jgi:hypothetical protein
MAAGNPRWAPDANGRHLNLRSPCHEHGPPASLDRRRPSEIRGTYGISPETNTFVLDGLAGENVFDTEDRF